MCRYNIDIVHVWLHGALSFNHVCLAFNHDLHQNESFANLKQFEAKLHLDTATTICFITSRHHFWMELNVIWCGLWSAFIFISAFTHLLARFVCVCVAPMFLRLCCPNLWHVFMVDFSVCFMVNVVKEVRWEVWLANHTSLAALRVVLRRVTNSDSLWPDDPRRRRAWVFFFWIGVIGLLIIC